MNDSVRLEPQRQRDELPRDQPRYGSQAEPPAAGNRGTRLLRRVPVAIIVMFWLAQFSNITVMRMLRFPEEGSEMLLPRAIVTLCGVGFGLAILWVQRRARRLTLKSRSLIAALLAILGACAHTITNASVFQAFFPDYELMLSSYVPAVFDWIWFYTALSIVILCLTYVADLADNEERIASLQARADAFQLAALRYQLNPHFLFNTLNAIASLISRRSNAEAEAMVVSLSDFLRSTLRIDAAVEITLGEEVALQSLYLDIERCRFPHRLKVTIDVPDDLRRACVPNLILQPLVENAIKHGLAQSAKQVHVEILAAAEGGRLAIEVRDDGGDAPAQATDGANVGLTNVGDRLRVHFGDDRAGIEARPRPEGGFSARITMPLRHAA